MMRTSFIFALVALLISGTGYAGTINGVVVGVADGDTLTVLDSERQQHRIRLAGIDAPEKGQDFSQRSKQSLSTLAYRQQVVVETSKLDRYGRAVGKVLVGSQDVNLEQVRRGLAWHYTAYAREQPSADREAYAHAQKAAELAKIGLWSMPYPVAPWEFRRSKRSVRTAALIN